MAYTARRQTCTQYGQSNLNKEKMKKNPLKLPSFCTRVLADDFYSPVHKCCPKTSFYYINCNFDKCVGTMNKVVLAMSS